MNWFIISSERILWTAESIPSSSMLTSPRDHGTINTQDKYYLSHVIRSLIWTITSLGTHAAKQPSSTMHVLTLSWLSLWIWTYVALNGRKGPLRVGKQSTGITSRGLVSLYLLWSFLLEPTASAELIWERKTLSKESWNLNSHIYYLNVHCKVGSVMWNTCMVD